MKKELQSKGFTLIEILTVLVIITIAAVIAVPKYFDMMEKSEEHTLNGALMVMQGRANRVFSASMVKNNGIALLDDIDTFDDIDMGSKDEIERSLRDFVGTWSYVNETTIEYLFKRGNKKGVFNFTSGTADSPPIISLNVI